MTSQLLRRFLNDLPRSPRLVWALLLFGMAVMVYSLGLGDAETAPSGWVLYLAGGFILAVPLAVLVSDMLRQSRASRQRKRALIRQLSSGDPGMAADALQQLRRHGWHHDGTLQAANLAGANLPGANLKHGMLRGTNLWQANLRGAALAGANLREASLRVTDLQGANLRRADLREATLYAANLRAADLRLVNLRGANLWGASLEEAWLVEANLYDADLNIARLTGATLTGAIYSEKTRLPDGTYWTAETDMTRFTHPDSAVFPPAALPVATPDMRQDVTE